MPHCSGGHWKECPVLHTGEGSLHCFGWDARTKQEGRLDPGNSYQNRWSSFSDSPDEFQFSSSATLAPKAGPLRSLATITPFSSNKKAAGMALILLRFVIVSLTSWRYDMLVYTYHK